jgi:hypothetical protein
VPPPSSASASDCATLSDNINWLNRNSYMIAGLTQALIDAGVISKDAKINPD